MSDYKLHKASEQANAVQNQMKQNIELVIKRGADLDEIDEKSKALEDSARLFHKKSSAIRRLFCWRNWKLTLLILFILAVIVGFIVLILSV